MRGAFYIRNQFLWPERCKKEQQKRKNVFTNILLAMNSSFNCF